VRDSLKAAEPNAHWYEALRRCAQHNLNEHDPQSLDIQEWADYWKSLELDALVLTAGGFIAMYPTALPHHHRSQFLEGRDFLGDYVQAIRDRGIRVVARIETNWVHEEVFRERPQWVRRHADGNPVQHRETPWVYRTCMFSDYYTRQVPAIMREIADRYNVDGFFTNSWPPSGGSYRCFCESCGEAADRSLRESHERQEKRILEIVELLNRTAGQAGPDCVYNINIGGGIRASQNLFQLGSVGSWLTSDHQGRSGDTPMWDITQQGRVAHAIMGTRPVTNVVGTKSGPWRHSSRTEAELEMWLSGCTASGMIPWLVWLGGDVEDRRWQETGRRFYRWHARSQRHFTNVESMATIGVVLSQRANVFYRAPGTPHLGYGACSTDAEGPPGIPTHELQGMHYALLKGRCPFDFVHEENLGPKSLGRYSTLILPNVALMSETQCSQIREYVESGGNLLATFETSRYDEWGERCRGFGLSDVFGVRPTAGAARVSGAFYSRVRKTHEILAGMGGLSRLPGGEHHVPLEPSADAVLTVMPTYPQGIPEMVYPYPRAETDFHEGRDGSPYLVVRQFGKGTVVYISADIGRCYWLCGNADLGALLHNAVRWLAGDSGRVSVTGDGVVDTLYTCSITPTRT